jgi:hypothetical protein
MLGATRVISGEDVGLAQHECFENFGGVPHVFGAGGRAAAICTWVVFGPKHPVAIRGIAHRTTSLLTSQRVRR